MIHLFPVGAAAFQEYPGSQHPFAARTVAVASGEEKVSNYVLRVGCLLAVAHKVGRKAEREVEQEEDAEVEGGEVGVNWV